VARLRYSRSARKDLGQIYRYIRQESSSGTVALRFVTQLRRKCDELASAPIQMGRPRDELYPGLRSHVYGNYIIFFRYIGEVLEVVNVLEGHRDISAVFDDRKRR
jgi:toxin ParE1/3/4